MRYDEYRRKVKKFAAVLNFIRRNRVILIGALTFLLVAAAALVGVRGTIYEVKACPATVVYGEPVGYVADAVFGKAVYEYAASDSSEWSEDAPVATGRYKVRAKALGPFGTTRYGKERVFTVVPRQTDVKASDPTVKYGDLPAVSADLAYADEIYCGRFVYEDVSARETSVTPDLSAIRVTNARGEDVTSCYSFRAVAVGIGFDLRKITVIVQDKSGIYDGNALKFDGYELSEETPLAEGDSLIATFETQRTDAGISENVPKLRVVRKNGSDVTKNYEIEIIAGKLTVEKRPLYVKTGSAKKIYDGTPLYCEEYSVEAPQADSGLINGHSIAVAERCYAQNAGKTENLLRFSVNDGTSDVSSNYCVFYDAGILEIEPRSLSVTTADETWTYDGVLHASGKFSVAESDEISGLIAGHAAVIGESCSVLDVGKTANETKIAVHDGEGTDVTANYEISYQTGVLEIIPRKVSLRTDSAQWIFDGITHYESGFEVLPESLFNFAEGDVAETVTSSGIAEVGTANNEITLRVFNKDGRDVTPNYIFTYEFGTLSVTPRPITVIAASAEKIYDGTPLKENGFEAFCPFGDALAMGHAGAAVNVGEQTDVGTGVNSVAEFTVTAGERDVTFNYQITYEDGALTVTPRPIVITSGSAEKIYDGTPLTCDEYQISCEYGFAIVSGQEVSVQVIGEQVDAGEWDNLIGSVEISDGLRNVTFNYSLEYRYGILKILRRPVTVDVGSGTWIFDGNPHFCNSFSVSENTPYDFLQGHRAVVVAMTVITDVGTSENQLYFSVRDEEYLIVTDNYEISQNYGVLEVTPRPITVKAIGGEKVYDGEPLVASRVEISSECEPAIVNGHNAYTQTYGKQTDVGNGECGVDIFTVYDENGNDKTYDYEITFLTDILTVTPRPVKFTAASIVETYNGKPVYSGEAVAQAEINGEGLLSWHVFTLQTTGSITEVGKTVNEITEGSVRIFENTRDVTFNYTIFLESGVIEVVPLSITVETGSAEKMYDGVPLVKHTCEIVYELAEGQTLQAEYSGTQTEIGFSENTLKSIRILDGERDVTHNYDIQIKLGRLTVQIPDGQLYIVTSGAEKVYDGTPLTCDEFTLENTLPDGYIVEAECVGSKLFVGTEYNYISVKVTSEAGKDVTDVIRVSCKFGILSVTKRPIVIQTDSNSWPYDGQAHYEKGHSVSEVSKYQIAEGEETSVLELSYIFDVGVKQNELEIGVFDEDGTDTTNNYSIQYIYGLLEVTESDYQGGSRLDTSGSFGGGALPGGDSSGKGRVALKVNSEVGGMVYLRLMSFGDYTGRKWLQATSYDTWMDDMYCMNYLTGVALENAGYADAEIKIQVFGEDYLLPYYLAKGAFDYNIQTSDVRYQGLTDKIYSLRYYPYDYVSEGGFSADLAQYKAMEFAYRLYVTNHYLYVPGSTLSYLDTIIAKEGFNRKDPSVVSKVAKYIQGAAVYNSEFDPMLNSESDVVVSFLRDYKEGICQHFASAATMLYRALGIPARYTIGYASDTVAGEWTDIDSLKAHAWVEVYIDGLGWVNVEVTGGGPVFGEGGSIGGKPSVINIKPADEIKQYDGLPLYAESVVGATVNDIYYFRELLNEGYTYKAIFEGERTEIGETYSQILSFEFYAPNGEKETGIRFRYLFGRLKVVEEAVITVRPYSLQKYYDGTPLMYDENDYTISGLPQGYSLRLSLKGIGLTDAGVLDLSVFEALPVKVFNEAEVDVTNRFYITFDAEYALMVSRRKITVTTASDVKIYDGKPLINGGYRVSLGSLAENDSISVTVTGAITDIGKANNTIGKISIKNLAGKDVTKNYDITVLLGVLEILEG